MAFDISKYAKTLPNVSDSDTDMLWIDRVDILDNPLNFYPKPNGTELTDLMESIRVNGLLEPPTVVPYSGMYRLISGHSRLAAIRLLVETTDEDDRWKKILCRVLPPMSKDQELSAVIEANRQRVKTPALLADEAARLTASYVARKESGEELPGRTRDRVAKTLNISPTKLANVTVIKKGLKVPGFIDGWEKGHIPENAALEIARLGLDEQYRLLDWSIEKNMALTVMNVKKFHIIWTCFPHKCPGTAGLCPNAEAMYDAFYRHGELHCAGCCRGCLKKDTCRVACQYCGKKAAEEPPKAEIPMNPAVNDPRLRWEHMGKTFCGRVAELREKTGLSRKEFAESIGEFQGTYSAWENKSMPGAERIPKLALCLGVSTDYLYGLTDDPAPQSKPEGQMCISGWMPGGTQPTGKPGQFAALLDIGGWLKLKFLDWDGTAWKIHGMTVNAGVLPKWWIRLPPEPDGSDGTE